MDTTIWLSVVELNQMSAFSASNIRIKHVHCLKANDVEIVTELPNMGKCPSLGP
jgi:hypothetical protein